MLTRTRLTDRPTDRRQKPCHDISSAGFHQEAHFLFIQGATQCLNNHLYQYIVAQAAYVDQDQTAHFCSLILRYIFILL